MPSRASAAPSASCTIVTPTPRAILPRNRASVAPAPESGDSTTAAAASTRRQNGGSDWRSSHWSYRVCGATCLYAPATDAEYIADAAVNLTNQQPSSPRVIFYYFYFSLTFLKNQNKKSACCSRLPPNPISITNNSFTRWVGDVFVFSVPVRNGRTADIFIYKYIYINNPKGGLKTIV